ncbi:transglutaminase family protein [Maricurvus nonylphenolicus]
MSDTMEVYLQPTTTIDCDHAAVQAYVDKHIETGQSDLEKAVALYYAVRDDFRYDPYSFRLEEESFKASTTLEAGLGWCVPKAILLAACCRAAGIPAKLGFADVKNHLSTERMRQQMKTDVFHWHGYTSIFLEGQWVKATPAFNIELCDKFGLKPLEFTGREDSIYHEFDKAGNKHMEYLQERGEYADLPLAEMLSDFDRLYGPEMAESFKEHSFDKDVAKEVGS